MRPGKNKFAHSFPNLNRDKRKPPRYQGSKKLRTRFWYSGENRGKTKPTQKTKSNKSRQFQQAGQSQQIGQSVLYWVGLAIWVVCVEQGTCGKGLGGQEKVCIQGIYGRWGISPVNIGKIQHQKNLYWLGKTHSLGKPYPNTLPLIRLPIYPLQQATKAMLVVQAIRVVVNGVGCIWLGNLGNWQSRLSGKAG